MNDTSNSGTEQSGVPDGWVREELTELIAALHDGSGSQMQLLAKAIGANSSYLYTLTRGIR